MENVILNKEVAEKLFNISSIETTADSVEVWVSDGCGGEQYKGCFNFCEVGGDTWPIIDEFDISIGTNSKGEAWASSPDGKVMELDESKLKAVVKCFLKMEIKDD